jgi:dUTP pyrophosphatase
MSRKLKYKLLTEGATIPAYATPGDAGMDLTATKIIKEDLFSVWYNTDVAVEIPPGHFGMLVPRSSISNDGALTLSNDVGIIDAGFRGGMQVRFNRTVRGFFSRKKYNVGDRVAQLIIIPFKSVELERTVFLSKTERGDGGHGSTGT